MESTANFHGVEVRPGERVCRLLDVATLASGATIRIPVHIVNGSRRGPVLCMTSVIHGPETFSIDIIRETLSRIDSQCLRGAVIAIPVANPVAFDAQTTTTPSDNLNLNRAFLPDAESRADNGQKQDLTVRMAACLAQWVSESDCLLDYHCGTGGMAINYVYVPEVPDELGEQVRRIARAYGLKVMYLGSGFPNSISAYALSLGIPALALEIGGGLDLPAWYLEDAVRGVFNVMKHLGMLRGKPVLPETQYLLKERALIKPKHGGILHTEVGLEKLNEILPKGELICRVISPMTFEELEAIEAPYEETITFMLRGRRTFVQPGNTTCFVGNVRTADLLGDSA